MILKRIQAENILKYRQLHLTDLPTQGQIAVAGRNEAGKTAIGETICFALFGRTFSLPPKEVTRVIRWGEFKGSVTLEFTGRDGGDYVITRQIDNNGKQDVRLLIAGDGEPVAEGVEAVDEAVHEVGGFTYRSFIDSFYLAQREMEVPHAKSATVKALIGVDRLETAAGQLHAEMTATAHDIRKIDAEVGETQSHITAVGLDRAHLGRVESQRESKEADAEKAEENCEQQSARAANIAKSAESFARAAQMFVSSTLSTNFTEWRQRRQEVEVGLATAAKASQAAGAEVDSSALDAASTAVHCFDDGLSEYGKVRDLAGLYQERLTALLDETPVRRPAETDPVDEDESRFIDRLDDVDDRIYVAKRRRKPVLGFGVFFTELAAVAWIGWAVLLAAPESTVAGWLRAIVGGSESTRQLVFLFGALLTTTITAGMCVMFRNATQQLREFAAERENIEAATQTARSELSMMDAIEQAAVPDALAALRGVQNPLLHRAVVAFADGDGAVLVKPDALDEKLGQIHDGSDKAVRSLLKARDRLMEQAEHSRDEALELREEVAALDQEITVEKQRWEEVEGHERTLAGLQAKSDSLRQDIRVRKLGCEMIEGATRRIYSRFHPELRRFVSKILPHLTEERYQHLELDDDLRVRVFCNEKNDFVGLAEISNGTHRQLMLCVRLALSQALIASSSKAAQFIFFDEPFAFFDQQRMARAIDVLGKISPQLTQVWLAAQEFDDRSRFDMFIDCGVDSDTLEMSGNGAAKPATAVA